MTENFDAERRPVKASDRRSGPYPYYGAQGVVDHVDGFLFDGEYVLVAEDGENLRSRKAPIALMAKGRFWVNNHAHIVRGNKNANSRFLFYAINSTDIAGYITGSTIPKLSQGSLNRITIPCPPVQVQNEIVSILGALDDKIELNRRMNETLEAMARAIFQDWFVAFGPIRAKMEARPPYLAPDLWALFPDALDGEGKPEGWQASPISSFASLGREAVSPMSAPDELFDHYSLPAFDAGQMAVRELGAGILSNKTLVSRHAVLLSKLNPEIPRVWLVDADAAIRSICSTEFLVLMPNIEADRAFLYCALTDPGFKQRLEAQVTGTSKSHQRVNPRSVLDAAVFTAPPVVMSAFHHQATPLLERILANRRESRTLAATRDLLLPRLMSGELRVKDAERAVEEAA
uniref:restriction endonuclease subunit S n=1 Tax=Rhodovarius lipocyclicus TaxID=268410 RepID=UPI0019177B41